jgi:hypothetical protein
MYLRISSAFTCTYAKERRYLHTTVTANLNNTAERGEKKIRHQRFGDDKEMSASSGTWNFVYLPNCQLQEYRVALRGVQRQK